jgi:hypothetical protein
MIDFNSSQLTWILIGACSMGGTGYLTMDSKIAVLDTKVEVNSAKMDDMKTTFAELQKQLTRMEDKLDRKQGLKQ